MNDHYHDSEQGIQLLAAQVEVVVDHLSTHSNRFMGLAKKINTDHFDNMYKVLKMVGSLACNPETKESAVKLLDQMRDWNDLVEQVGEVLIDISQDLVAFFDATTFWAMTEAQRAMAKREAMENVQELEGL